MLRASPGLNLAGKDQQNIQGWSRGLGWTRDAINRIRQPESRRGEGWGNLSKIKKNKKRRTLSTRE